MGTTHAVKFTYCRDNLAGLTITISRASGQLGAINQTPQLWDHGIGAQDVIVATMNCILTWYGLVETL
jgi:hypothetical protein